MKKIYLTLRVVEKSTKSHRYEYQLLSPSGSVIATRKTDRSYYGATCIIDENKLMEAYSNGITGAVQYDGNAWGSFYGSESLLKKGISSIDKHPIPGAVVIVATIDHEPDESQMDDAVYNDADAIMDKIIATHQHAIVSVETINKTKQ